MSECARCQGRGKITPLGIKTVECPVCLGLGSYERARNKQRPQPTTEHHIMVLHSSVDINDVIDLLPEAEKEGTDE